MTPSPATHKPAILYVDDDRENLDGLKAVLRRDYDVYLAESAREAMGILEQVTIQVLITDQRMPEMSGSDLLERLADQHPNMLRFMLTGFSDFDPLVKALNDGQLQGYFSKPLDVPKAKERIEKGLAKYYLKVKNEELNVSLRQSEQQVRIQLAELEQLYNVAPVGLILVDKEYRVVRINEKLAEIDGGSVESHLGRTLDEVVPDLADDLKKIYGPVIEKGEPVVNISIHGTTPSQPGVERDWLGNYYPFKNDDGDILGVIGGVIEVTELKKAEKEALDANRFAENLLQTANAMIVGLDQDGCIQIVNPTVEKVTGYSMAEALGRNWFELVVPKDIYPDEWEEYSRMTGSGIPQTYQKLIRTKDGDERIISWSNIEIKEEGNLVRTLSVGIDVTRLCLAEEEKERLADQLRQAQKMEAIGTLAGGIAHDFNNILSPIIGYAEIIIDDAEPGSGLGASAREILNAGMRARDLIFQILTFSREQEQEKKPIKVQPVIKEALKLLRASVPTTIELNQRIEDDCGPILGDPTQIYQVIMNLCTNAYQAMQDQGGRIDVVAEEVLLSDDDQPQFMEVSSGPFVRVTFSDTGPGISPETMERIFDPYFTTKRMKSGTGLGLSVVHGIVKGHGGAIKVYSEQGEGTSFIVYLPRLADISSQKAVSSDTTIAGGTESILLVDDEAAIVKVAKKILQNLGYQVTEFTDPRIALSHFKDNPGSYDLVISDFTMPHLTGSELAEGVMAEAPNTPFVICTGLSEPFNRYKASKYGICRVVNKPILKTEMARVVREALEMCQ